LRSSIPPGSRTSGSSPGSSASISAAALGSSSVLGIAPGVRQAIALRELDDPPRRLRGVRADDLHPDALLLERLAPRDERREQQIRERAVLEQQRTQLVAIDARCSASAV
jgi:hypothetical protein